MMKIYFQSIDFQVMYSAIFFSVGNRSTVRTIFFNGANLASGSKSL
jgi:hypothetical protein